jgi:deoxyribonuclease V
MIAGVDVDYRATGGAVAACVLFRGWQDPAPAEEWTERIAEVLPYEPGAFYRRELPCLLKVLSRAAALSAVVVDGYVWLDGQGRPGLGAHLFEALSQKVPVIGVAKTAFAGASLAVPVVRGQSQKPLYVSAAGMEAGRAAECIEKMHGEFRLPALLKRVDGLCRGLLTPLDNAP